MVRRPKQDGLLPERDPLFASLKDLFGDVRGLLVLVGDSREDRAVVGAAPAPEVLLERSRELVCESDRRVGDGEDRLGRGLFIPHVRISRWPAFSPRWPIRRG